MKRLVLIALTLLLLAGCLHTGGKHGHGQPCDNCGQFGPHR